MKTFQNLFLPFLLLCLTSCQAKTEERRETKRNVKQLNVTWNKENKKLFRQLPNSITDVLAWAKYFIGTPYEAATLEKGNDSVALINFEAFDCTTYVENIVVLTHLDSLSEENFTKVLETIRYRDGEPKGYASRLNYFSEWILDNEKKGFVKDITKDLGGIPVKKKLNFMTTHRAAYSALKDGTVYAKILATEQQLSEKERYLIPKYKIIDCENQIKDGDIIALATNISGLDFVHVGFAIHQEGRLHLLHASSKAKQVVISDKTLADYVKNRKSVSGIVVLRCNE